jgi:DNA polymerase-3 subunit delta'
MITGVEGVGKFEVANQVARGLLCKDGKQGDGCRKCQACQLFESGNHPDYHLLTNEYKAQGMPARLMPAVERYIGDSRKSGEKRKSLKRVIGVEQIRNLTAELLSTAHLGASKVSIIYPANELNINAANALLKTLEEPPSNTHFFLVTEAAYMLPPTVRSRCVQYRVSTPAVAQSLRWLEERIPITTPEAQQLLQFSDNSPLMASNNFEDGSWTIGKSLPSDLEAILDGKVSIVAACKKWNRISIRMPLKWLQREILNAFRHGVGVESTATGQLLYLRVGLKHCLETYTEVGKFLQWPVNAVDEQLFLESILAGLTNRT